MSATAEEAHTAASTEPNPRRWIALAVIAISQLMVVLDATIVNIALPSAQSDLHISNANRQWVVTAYTLAFGGLLLFGGRVADYWGRKRTFLVGAAGFAAASAIGGLAQNGLMLFAARALQGVFGALLAPASLALLTVLFVEARERARAFAVYGAIAGGGSAVGLLLGGVLTEYANWRWCLLVNIPVAALALALAIPLVPESKAHGDTSYDVGGAVVVTLGLASLVYGFTKAASDGWGATVTIAFITAGVVLLAIFVLIERKNRNPLLPLRVVLDRNRGGSYLIFLLVGAGLFAMFLFLTYYFQINLGYSPLKSGFAFLPFSAGIILAAGGVAQLLPRLGPKPLMVPGLVAAVLGMLWLTQIGSTSSYATHVLPSEIIMSVGLACVFIPASSTALIGVGHHDAGVASAVLNTSQMIGGSLGTALLNTVFAGAVTSYFAEHLTSPGNAQKLTPLALIHGYHVSFFWGAGLFTAALLCALVFITAKKEDIPAEGAMAA
jgi:EmrB/QacA subfamily drug resistance transporter